MEKDNVLLLIGFIATILVFLMDYIESTVSGLFMPIAVISILGGFIIRFPKLLKRLRKQLKGEESSKENEDI